MSTAQPWMDADEAFFAREPGTYPLYEAIAAAILKDCPDVTIHVQKTQIAFTSRYHFAFVSLPFRRRRGRPDVYVILTFGLGHRLEDPRIIEAVEPYPGRWTHHVLIADVDEVDDQVRGWLVEAYEFANTKGRRPAAEAASPAAAGGGMARLQRPVHPMPAEVSAALDDADLWDRYRARPPYQRNDYIGWIARAKRPETARARLDQMLDELESGDAYMGMPYRAR